MITIVWRINLQWKTCVLFNTDMGQSTTHAFYLFVIYLYKNVPFGLSFLLILIIIVTSFSILLLLFIRLTQIKSLRVQTLGVLW